MMRAITGGVVAVVPQHRFRLACLDELGHDPSPEEQDDLALGIRDRDCHQAAGGILVRAS